MTVKSRILELFSHNRELSAKELTDRLGVSKQMVHIALKQLTNQQVIERLGRPPKTIYRVIQRSTTQNETPVVNIPAKEHNYLAKNFLSVTETGNLLVGYDAFTAWCKQRKLPVEKTLSEYILTKQKYNSYYDANANINGLEKLRNTKGYEKIWLDELYYLDFYAIERFGKTRLGTLLHYAKQGQNKFLMDIMMKEIEKRIKSFVVEWKADAIGFVPPTIRREVQLMKFIQSRLNLSLPVLDIKKVSGIIPVPQKSLTKLEERIRNAEDTFAITEQRNFKTVVLIDDAVDSGATINQIAGKIKTKGVAKKVIGLAIVGSFKGFDVITDV